MGKKSKRRVRQPGNRASASRMASGAVRQARRTGRTAQGAGMGEPGLASPDQLSARIESLQAAFRQLSRAATIKDLAARLSEVVQKTFSSTAVNVCFLPANAGQWQDLAGSDDGDLVARIAGERLSSLCAVREGEGCICAVQQLVDGALVGITLTQTGPDAPGADPVTMRLLGHLFDTAYQELLSRRTEKDLIFSLNHRVLQLNSLIDTGIEVAKLDQSASPQQLALERAASLTNASKGIVRISREGEPVEEITFPAGSSPSPSETEGRSIRTDFTFEEQSFTFELYDKESRSGIIPFDETDQLLLDALARQVHASLENRYLVRQALEKQRLEQDLSVAASIQQRILPTALPEISGYDLAGINIPSKSVGGDYYDCIPLPNGTVALVIADVAGKGMPAALLVSSFHAYLQAYLESGVPLVELVQRLNRAIYYASTDDKFITAFLGVFSPDTGELESVNAGHNPSYWLKNDGSVAELSAGGVALGMFDMEFPFQSEKITIGRGERLLLYTDGIPEAADHEHKLYESRTPLQQFLAEHTPADARGFIDDLIADIRGFTGDAPQSDDITALYLIRRP